MSPHFFIHHLLPPVRAPTEMVRLANSFKKKKNLERFELVKNAVSIRIGPAILCKYQMGLSYVFRLTKFVKEAKTNGKIELGLAQNRIRCQYFLSCLIIPRAKKIVMLLYPHV